MGDRLRYEENEDFGILLFCCVIVIMNIYKTKTVMRIIYFSLLLICLLMSCQQKSKEKRDVDPLETETLMKENNQGLFFDIDLDKIIQEAEGGQLPLSTFISEIEYVPLETTNKSLIGEGALGIQQYIVTDKIIMADMKIFSRQDGHYIGDLLKKGEGPEEYLYIMGVDADDERKEFYLYDGSRLCIHIVGYDNTYKGAINDCGDYANVYSLGNGDVLIPNYNSLVERHDVFFIENVDTKKIVYKWVSPALQGITKFEDCKRVGKIGSYINIIGTIPNMFWKYDNEMRYYDSLTDTVYRLNKEYQLKPLGRLNTEKLRMTLDQWSIGAMSRNFYSYYLMNVFESTNNIFFYLHKDNPVISDYKLYWVIFSKNEGSFMANKN